MYRDRHFTHRCHRPGFVYSSHITELHFYSLQVYRKRRAARTRLRQMHDGDDRFRYSINLAHRHPLPNESISFSHLTKKEI
jgi:hypothetical protein